MKTKSQIIEKDKLYYGELWVDNVLVSKTKGMLSKTICIKQLNRRIESYNLEHGLVGRKAIPAYIERTQQTTLPVIDAEANKKEQKNMDTQIVTVKTQRKKVIPRKPFTPYGLKGYQIDKNNNIRLHLDRRANAQTIVLTPDMFTMLADMVKATQLQGVK